MWLYQTHVRMLINVYSQSWKWWVIVMHHDDPIWWTILMHHDVSSWWFVMMHYDDRQWWIIMKHYSGSSWWIILLHHDDSSSWIIIMHFDDESRRVAVVFDRRPYVFMKQYRFKFNDMSVCSLLLEAPQYVRQDFIHSDWCIQSLIWSKTL